VPYELAALFCAERETLRSRLGVLRGRFLSDGEVFGATLECPLLAWTPRGLLTLAARSAMGKRVPQARKSVFFSMGRRWRGSLREWLGRASGCGTARGDQPEGSTISRGLRLISLRDPPHLRLLSFWPRAQRGQAERSSEGGRQ